MAPTADSGPFVPPPALGAGDPLQAMLGQLRGEGKLESSGGFTLDLHKSLEKLSQFQLEEPRSYVHSLVAAACCLGASFIQIEVGPRELLAGFDGQGFSFPEMVPLFECLFDFEHTATGRAAHHMAFALNGARQVNPNFVLFDSFHGAQASRVQITSGLLQVARLASRPWENSRIVNRFHLREPVDSAVLKRLVGNVVGDLLGSSQPLPEQEFMQNGRCGFAPLEVWINGQRVLPRLDAFLDYWMGESSCLSPPGLMLGAPSAPQRWSGGVGLCQQRKGAIYWILDGLAYRDARERELPPEVAFWIYRDDLKTDVSQGLLVNGTELREARHEIRQLGRTLLPGLQARLRENPRAAGKFKEFAATDLGGGI